MALRMIYVVCECGAPVDVVEFDDAGVSKPVQDVMDALNWDEQRARDFVARENPGAELSNEEAARALAEKITKRSVPDRDRNTYLCAQGHYDTALTVSETRPAPTPVSIVKVPATVADRLAELDDRNTGRDR